MNSKKYPIILWMLGASAVLGSDACNSSDETNASIDIVGDEEKFKDISKKIKDKMGSAKIWIKCFKDNVEKIFTPNERKTCIGVSFYDTDEDRMWASFSSIHWILEYLKSFKQWKKDLENLEEKNQIYINKLSRFITAMDAASAETLNAIRAEYQYIANRTIKNRKSKNAIDPNYKYFASIDMADQDLDGFFSSIKSRYWRLTKALKPKEPHYKVQQTVWRPYPMKSTRFDKTSGASAEEFIKQEPIKQEIKDIAEFSKNKILNKYRDNIDKNKIEELVEGWIVLMR